MLETLKPKYLPPTPPNPVVPHLGAFLFPKAIKLSNRTHHHHLPPENPLQYHHHQPPGPLPISPSSPPSTTWKSPVWGSRDGVADGLTWCRCVGVEAEAEAEAIELTLRFGKK